MNASKSRSKPHPAVWIFLFLIVVLGMISCASQQQPPDKIITLAKQRTVAIIDSIKINVGTVEGSPQLVKEYYDKDNHRYVLEYHVDTVFGAALSDTPTVYIVKENNQWHYQFQYDQYYDTILSDK